MNILVTGAAGQLGSSIKAIAKSPVNNYIFTDSSQLDITSSDSVGSFVDSHNIDIIVNCAAYTNVDAAEDDVTLANLVNNIAPKQLAQAAAVRNMLLIHISTDYVFSGDGNIPRVETDNTEPIGVYGKTKLDGEKGIVESGARYIILRTSWLYSSFGNNFVKTIRKFATQRDMLSVVFDQVGSPTYAGDLAQAICHIVENPSCHDKQGVYHYSNEGVCSWFDFAYQIVKESKYNCVVTPCYSSQFPSKVKRPHYSVMDKSKFKDTFGVAIPYWSESLARCINEIENI